MDPFSITAGAIGISGFTINSFIQLRNVINDLSDAQELLKDINSSLQNIERPLNALEQLEISDESTLISAKGDLEKAGVAEAVNSCAGACDKFSKNLVKWTKHSSATKLSLRDQLSVGVWNQEKIRTFRMQLQSCEATVQFAVVSTQLILQLRSEARSEVSRESVSKQLQTLETKIQEHLNLSRRQQDEAQQRMRELQEEPEDEDDDGAQRTLAMKEVEEQLRQLEADQVACGVVFSQVQSRRSGQDIGNVFTSDDSKALVGLPDSVVGKINQRIKEVRTVNSSVAVVGVYSYDFKF